MCQRSVVKTYHLQFLFFNMETLDSLHFSNYDAPDEQLSLACVEIKVIGNIKFY